MIQNWFNPINISKEEYNFGIMKHEYQKDILNISNSKAVIFALDKESANMIRKSLSKFKNHFKKLELYDLGDIKNASSEFALQAMSELMDGKIVSIVLGGNTELFEKTSNYLTKMQGSHDGTIISNHIVLERTEIDNTSFIGFQRHLCEMASMENETLMDNSMSLGNMRSNPSLVEPILRDTALGYFNMNAVRKSDAPNCTDSIPTGLTAEEACQLMRHLGESSQMKAMMFECNIGDVAIHESDLIAELVWYFLEGIKYKRNIHPLESSDTQEFIIDLKSGEGEISFVRNNQNNKWWLKLDDKTYLPCSEEEYKATINNSMPDRLLNKLF